MIMYILQWLLFAYLNFLLFYNVIHRFYKIAKRIEISFLKERYRMRAKFFRICFPANQCALWCYFCPNAYKTAINILLNQSSLVFSQILKKVVGKTIQWYHFQNYNITYLLLNTIYGCRCRKGKWKEEIKVKVQGQKLCQSNPPTQKGGEDEIKIKDTVFLKSFWQKRKKSLTFLSSLWFEQYFFFTLSGIVLSLNFTTCFRLGLFKMSGNDEERYRELQFRGGCLETWNPIVLIPWSVSAGQHCEPPLGDG